MSEDMNQGSVEELEPFLQSNTSNMHWLTKLALKFPWASSGPKDSDLPFHGALTLENL